MVDVKINMTGWKMWEHGVPNSKLIVIKQVADYIEPNGKHRAQWLCECSCKEHNKIIAIGKDIRNGRIKSCKCLLKAKQNTVNKRNYCKKLNTYELNMCDEHGLYGCGYCSNTGKKFYFDMIDYNLIKDYTWSERVDDSGYHSLVTRDPNTKKNIKMHYLLFEKYCDHADRNPLNNRRYNLRHATQFQNAQNRRRRENNISGITGVYFDKKGNCWMANISINGKRIILGRFTNKYDAIITRLNAELHYYGEFAPQRHLFEQYKINEKR